MEIKQQIIKFLLSVLLLTLMACQTLVREPTSADSANLALLFPEQLNANNCTNRLEKLKNEINLLRLRQTELMKSPESLQSLDNKMFHFRRMTSASNLPDHCVIQLRQIFPILRALRDYTAEPFFENNSVSTYSYQLVDQNLLNYEYRTGDLFLTRGNSFLSATISQVSTNHSQYSHVAYIYVDPITKKVFTLESYPTKGARIYTLAGALKNDNDRIQLFRPRDANKAKIAVEFMYRKIFNAQVTHQPINYDYLYDPDDHTRLSCVEVVQEAYQLSLGEKIPALRSQVEINNPSFLKSIGVKTGPFFAPADLETDPRFELMWEWTDFKKTVDERMKDVILERLFYWIGHENYALQGNLKSLGTKLFLALRSQPTVWSMLSTKIGVTGIPLEIPAEILSTMVKSNDIGRILMTVIESKEKEIYQKEKRHLTEIEMQQLLENFRAEDREQFLLGKTAPLHFLIRPYELQVKPNE